MSNLCIPNLFVISFIVLMISCKGQVNNTLPEDNVPEEQLNNLIGTRVLVNSGEQEDTLALFKDGHFLLKTDHVQDSGNWHIDDIHHLTIGNNQYRFFFKGKNLVLVKESGDRHEFAPLHSPEVQQNTDLRISPFVRRIFQDKKGHYWFGTNGDGVVRYNGDTLEYFSVEEGFGGFAVRGIVEDKAGNVWFGTEGGLTRYDGNSFTNFTENEGLIHNDVWSLIIDSDGTIWVGTLGGVSRFDGKKFVTFELPETRPDSTRGITSARIVHCILEDSQGRMWFASNGGAFIWDGKSLSNISEKDGLCNNDVNCILEDKAGNIWFATHHNGVCRFDGNNFIHFSAEHGVEGIEVWDLYEDRSGNIWFPVEGFGMYRYDGQSFTNFNVKDGLASGALQCTFEDRQGRLWFGGWMGLFRYDGHDFFSVTKQGPWPE